VVDSSIKVRDVMRVSVVTARENETALTVAVRMKEKDVGSVVVVDSNKKPVGIVTREDIVVKVVAENKNPESVLVRDIMSSPLVTCKEEDNLFDVARVMNKYGYERLPVVDEEGNLKGIVSIREVLAVAPGLIEVFKDRLEKRLEERYSFEDTVIEGTCEICGNYSDELRNVDGLWVCSECAEKEGYRVSEE